MFWKGPKYHHPIDIPSTESVCPRSRTQPDPEPESPPLTEEYSCVPPADEDLPTTTTRQPENKEKRTGLTLHRESDQRFEPVTSVDKGVVTTALRCLQVVFDGSVLAPPTFGSIGDPRTCGSTWFHCSARSPLFSPHTTSICHRLGPSAALLSSTPKAAVPLGIASVLRHTGFTSALRYSGSTFNGHRCNIALVSSTSTVASFHRLCLRLRIHRPRLLRSSPSLHHLGSSLP